MSDDYCFEEYNMPVIEVPLQCTLEFWQDPEDAAVSFPNGVFFKEICEPETYWKVYFRITIRCLGEEASYETYWELENASIQSMLDVVESAVCETLWPELYEKIHAMPVKQRMEYITPTRCV